LNSAAQFTFLGGEKRSMSATATKADIVDQCKEASAHTRAQMPDSAYVYLLAVR
jgi:hypothetical protein